jgi:hypothetical protein
MITDGDSDSGKRGPGAPKGMRPIVWVCSGIIDSKLVSKKFVVNSCSSSADLEASSFMKDKVMDHYSNKYGCPPEIMLGPFYDKKTKKDKRVAKKRALIDRNIGDIKLTSKQKKAVFNGWHGVANYLEDDKDHILFLFLKEVSPDPNKKKATPLPGRVNISDLTLEE